MRTIALLAAVASVTLGVGAVIGKAFLVHAAEEKARQVINGLRVHDQSIDAVAIELTREVHRWWTTNSYAESPPLLWRLRPYLTHDYVPAIFRLPEGVIDTLHAEGLCDSAARTLGYILEAADIQSDQLNIVNRFAGAHSVVLARFPDGREAMLDPLYGIVPQVDGELISPDRAFEASKNPGFGGDIWRKLAPTSDDRFYEMFEHAVFSVQNTTLEIDVEVRLTDNESIALGQRDGSAVDVQRAGLSRGLTSSWTYLGHKYDRGWTRVLRFPQGTRVEIGLTEPVNSGFITTSTRPRIEGDALVYTVAAGESLAFVDGLAERDWTKLKSYQDVDYIHFGPADAEHKPVTDSPGGRARHSGRLRGPSNSGTIALQPALRCRGVS